MKIMEQEILNGVGKKTRLAYQKGAISEAIVMQHYKRNKKEADEYSLYGLKYNEMAKLLKECHNPILKAKIEDALATFQNKQQCGINQNKLSLEKLNGFLEDAVGGVGLKRVIHVLKNEVRKFKDKTLRVVLTLLETEYANLKAKANCCVQKAAYERKDALLDRLSHLLDGSGWRYGYSDTTGKNASYLVYVYLPNGQQLSWHSNDYNLYQKFPYCQEQWDGQVCSTLTKLVDFIKLQYGNLFCKVA